MNQHPELKEDLISGAGAIAAYLGEDVRRIYYLLEKGSLPAFKLAGRWYVRKSTLLRYFAKLEEKCDV